MDVTDWTAETQLCNRIPPLSESPYPWITRIAVQEHAHHGRLSEHLLAYIRAQIDADHLYGMLLAESVGIATWNHNEREWQWHG